MIKKIIYLFIFLFFILFIDANDLIINTANDDYTKIIMNSNAVYKGIDSITILPGEIKNIYLPITAQDTLNYIWYIQGGIVYTTHTIRATQSVVNANDTYTFISYIKDIWLFENQINYVTPFDAGVGTLWTRGYPLVQIKFQLRNTSLTDTAMVFVNIQMRTQNK